MALASFSMMPRDTQDLAHWSFAHAAHHRDINRSIFQNIGTIISEFVLDPFDPQNMENWLWQHQQMHAEMDAALGIQGNVLTVVDWQDEQALAEWISNHASEHYQAGQILGVG